MLLAMRCFHERLWNGLMAFEMCADLKGYGFRHQHGNRVTHLLVLRHARPNELVCIGERLKTCSFAYRQGAFLIRQKDRAPMRIAFCHDCTGEAVIPQSTVALRV